MDLHNYFQHISRFYNYILSDDNAAIAENLFLKLLVLKFLQVHMKSFIISFEFGICLQNTFQNLFCNKSGVVTQSFVPK